MSAFVLAPEEPERPAWYRVTDGRYAAAADEWGRPVGRGEPYLHIHEFPVLRETPKGVWLDLGGWMPPRFVLRDARKRYACPTKAEAWESFVARKRAQLRILTAQVAHVEEVLRMVPDATRQEEGADALFQEVFA
jgi:hypothetical protein